MEDKNMIAADCIVVSCCCQCMILQILIFILLKIPHTLIKKTKACAKRLRAWKTRTKVMQITGYDEDSFRCHGNSLRMEIDNFFVDESLRSGCCMDEIEGVLEDFSNKGEFAFGSFWSGEEELYRDEVRCRLIELFGSHVGFSYH